MSGRQYRKPKKRPSRERQDQLAEKKHEADLEELWTVLAANREETSWNVPWRLGINAGLLALELVRVLDPIERRTSIVGIDSQVKLAAIAAAYRFVVEPFRNTQAYWMLQEHHDNVLRSIFTMSDRYLGLALRMFQLYLANSDGGGIAYCSLLSEWWEKLPEAIDRNKILRRFRCKDALGIEPEFTQNFDDDQRRRAFYTAWDRGLYSVAYAVGRH